jgi:hypothetical protein
MAREQTILVVSEFAGEAFDGLVASACREIARKHPARVILASGFLRRYRYGGLRPSRILNYGVVYARSVACLLRHRPKLVIVDTSPPLIHLWMAFLGRLFHIKVYAWVMDYHPEIEARALERIPGLRRLARVLRLIDRTLLGGLSGVITLDGVMATTIRSRCAGLDVKVHPPWSKQGSGSYQPVTLNRGTEDFRIAYVGNLGAAHGLDHLEKLLMEVHPRYLYLLIVGGNRAGLQRWMAMGRRLGAHIEHTGRLPWEDLRCRLEEFRPNYALVLMDEGKAGLLSPSKYTSYLRLGLPVLYLGPRGTNADVVCRVAGAGLAATEAEIAENGAEIARSLLDLTALEQRQSATVTAHQAQTELNEVSFVDILGPWLNGATKVDIA